MNYLCDNWQKNPNIDTYSGKCKYLQACQWGLHDRARGDRHAGKSICQRDWSRKQHNNFYRKSRRQKFLFSQDSKETCSLIFVCHKKRYFRKTSHSLKGIIRKQTVTGTCVFSWIYIKLVNIKKPNNFEHVLYPLRIKREEKKNCF